MHQDFPLPCMVLTSYQDALDANIKGEASHLTAEAECGSETHGTV